MTMSNIIWKYFKDYLPECLKCSLFQNNILLGKKSLFFNVEQNMMKPPTKVIPDHCFNLLTSVRTLSGAGAEEQIATQNLAE